MVFSEKNRKRRKFPKNRHFVNHLFSIDYIFVFVPKICGLKNFHSGTKNKISKPGNYTSRAAIFLWRLDIIF